MEKNFQLSKDIDKFSILLENFQTCYKYPGTLPLYVPWNTGVSLKW